MAVTVRSVALTTSTATTITIARPAGVVAGDVLIAHLSQNTGGTPRTVAPPAGWSPVATYNAARPTTEVFVKVAGASEPADYTFTLSGSTFGVNLSVTAVVGADLDNPIDASSVANGSGTAMTAPGVMVGRAGNLLLSFASQFTSSPSATHAAPSGWAANAYERSSNTTLTTSSFIRADAPEGPSGNVTITSGNTSAWSVALVSINALILDTEGDAPPLAIPVETLSPTGEIGTVTGHAAALDIPVELGPVSIEESDPVIRPLPLAIPVDLPTPTGEIGAVEGTAASLDIAVETPTPTGLRRWEGGGPALDVAVETPTPTAEIGPVEGTVPALDVPVELPTPGTETSAPPPPEVPQTPGIPRVIPSLVIYDAPGGVALSGDLGPVAEGLEWSSRLPGGLATASWTLRRDALTRWPDLRPFAHVEITDQHGTLLWDGQLMPVARATTSEIRCVAESYWQRHLASREFTFPASRTVTPGEAVTWVLRQIGSDLTPENIEDHDAYTLDLGDEKYQAVTGRAMLEELSKLGDATGQFWDVEIRPGRRVWFTPRGEYARRFRVDETAGSIRIEPDPDDLVNAVRVRYRTKDGDEKRTSFYRDEISIERYGEVQRTFRENELTDAQAQSRARTLLTYHAQLRDALQIQATRVLNPAGAPVPVGHLRAGDIVEWEGEEFVLVEVRYSADDGIATLTPEHGENIVPLPVKVKREAEKVARVGSDRSLGTGGRDVRDAPRYTHSGNHAVGGPDPITPEQINAAPARHRQQHATDGDDALAPADIGAAPANHSHTPQQIGAAPASHTHNASQITGGNLSVDRIAVGNISMGASGTIRLAGDLHIGGGGSWNGTPTFFAGMGVAGTLSIQNGIIRTGQLFVAGTQKTAIIGEHDGSWTRFAAAEMERARFGVWVPIRAWERWLPMRWLWQRVRRRLDTRFLDNVQSPYLVRVGWTTTGWVAEVWADVRDDSPYQMPAYGAGMGPPSGTEPYGAWRK